MRKENWILDDSCSESFSSWEALLDAVNTMESNSSWQEIPRASEIEAIGVPGPIEAPLIADETGMDEEIIRSTAGSDSGRCYIRERGYPENRAGMVCCRSSAIAGLQERANIYGAAIGRESAQEMAMTLNLALKYATGRAKLLTRYGKITAVQGNAYESMPMPRLLSVMENAVSIYGSEFLDGTLSHISCTCRWSVGSLASGLRKAYAEISSIFKDDLQFVTVVEFYSSDTANSSALARPLFYYPNLGEYVRFCNGIAVKHTAAGMKQLPDGTGVPRSAVEKFEEAVTTDLFPRFNDTVENAKRMSFITVHHPENAFINFCNKARIPMKYMEETRDKLEQIENMVRTVNAHDFFLICNGLLQSVDSDERCRDKGSAKANLGELLFQMTSPEFDWKSIDLGRIIPRNSRDL